jgi:hypothetical protein
METPAEKENKPKSKKRSMADLREWAFSDGKKDW